MKKLLFLCSMMLLGVTTVSAQEFERGIFNRLGANAAVGTEGISLGLATCITPYLELSAGVNFFPSAKAKGDVNINGGQVSIPNLNTQSMDVYNLSKIKLEGDMKRTTFDVKLSGYPFGNSLALFVVAGLSMGGKELASLSGHSDEVARIYREHPEYTKEISAEVDKYSIVIDRQGNAEGDIRVKAVRPYLGIGYGRLVPKSRVGFRVELGAQFHGDLEVYQGGKKLDVNSALKGDDDISKIIDKLTVYPVLKFMLTTRIF